MQPMEIATAVRMLGQDRSRRQRDDPPPCPEPVPAPRPDRVRALRLAVGNRLINLGEVVADRPLNGAASTPEPTVR